MCTGIFQLNYFLSSESELSVKHFERTQHFSLRKELVWFYYQELEKIRYGVKVKQNKDFFLNLNRVDISWR